MVSAVPGKFCSLTLLCLGVRYQFYDFGMERNYSKRDLEGYHFFVLVSRKVWNMSI